jgi:uncharacterized phage protein gp47/JayE
MAFGVTSTGFTLKTIADIRSEIDDYQKNNVPNGAELVLSDDTILGHMNGSISQQLAGLWELGQDIYSSKDPDVANDWALDVLASLTGTSRNPYTKTLVTAQVNVNPNKALPAGSIANVVGRPDVRFVSLTALPAIPAGYSGQDVVFEAETAGTIEVAAGQLTEITVAVSGWTSVTNAADGTPGSEPEDDPDFRDKRDRELTSSGSTNLDAIIAGVSEVTGVLDVTGTENETDAIDANGLKPHSVEIIAYGGASADIAEAIFVEKAAGITTNGTTTETVTDSQGNDHDISFRVATQKVYYLDITITTGALWNGSTSETAIKTAVGVYVNALGIGEDVIVDSVKAAIMSEPGVFKITAFQHGFSSPPAVGTDLTVADDEIATSDPGDIGITT